VIREDATTSDPSLSACFDGPPPETDYSGLKVMTRNDIKLRDAEWQV
jgi:hypothetical protein